MGFLDTVIKEREYLERELGDNEPFAYIRNIPPGC